jgi:hypothetical protein
MAAKMTMDSLRKAAVLQRALESVWEWIDTFATDKDKKKYPFIIFDNITSAEKDLFEDGSTRSGWQGDLTLPRDVALRMLLAAEAVIVFELNDLGVYVKVKP